MTQLVDDLREAMGALRRLAPIIRALPEAPIYDVKLAGDRLEHHARTIDRAVSALESIEIAPNTDPKVDQALEKILTALALRSSPFEMKTGGALPDIAAELRPILLELARRPTPIRDVRQIAALLQEHLTTKIVGGDYEGGPDATPLDAVIQGTEDAARVVISALGFDFFPQTQEQTQGDPWTGVRPLRIRRWYAFAFDAPKSPYALAEPMKVFPEYASGFAPDDPEINSFVALHAGENHQTVVVLELRECY